MSVEVFKPTKPAEISRPKNVVIPKSAESFAVQTIRAQQQEITELRIVLNAYLEGVRTISEAMGHPFKGQTDKSVLDLANMAARKLKMLREVEEEVAASAERTHSQAN